MTPAIDSICRELADALLERGWFMAVAESCTGGLIAAACTEQSGSSFATYSNEAKAESVGLDPALIAAHGAVSEKVARAMAFGALRHSHAQVAVAVTGIAGPTGGSADKPVGTVWFGFDVEGRLHSETRRFDGDRRAVRLASVDHALARLLELVRQADRSVG